MNPSFARLVFAGILAAAASSQAATLVDWNFTGTQGPNALTPIPAGNTVVASSNAATLAGVTAGNITSGSSGIYTTALSWSNGNWATNEITVANWDLTGAAGSAGATGSVGDGTVDNWIQFALSGGPGEMVSITGVSLSSWRNGAGAAEDYKWGYSLNGGTTWTQFGSTVTQTEAGDSTFRTTSFTGLAQGSSVLLRFAPTGGSGNIHINDIVVTGELLAIPEPTTAGLAGLGLLAILRRRRA